MRCGASKNTSVRVSAASSARRARRSASRAGRNPSKENRSVGRPAMLSAAVMAEGPGTATTRRCLPAPRGAPARSPGPTAAACPRRSPARCARRRAVSPAARRCARVSLCSCSDTSGRDNAERCQQLPRPARVFRRDQLRGRELVARARRKIAQIADGRRDHRKTSQVCSHYTSPPRIDTAATREGYSTHDAHESSA